MTPVGPIAHYLIVYPDKPLIFHYSRGEGDMILTRIVREGVVTLDPPGLEFALAEICEAGGRGAPTAWPALSSRRAIAHGLR